MGRCKPGSEPIGRRHESMVRRGLIGRSDTV